MENKDQPAFPLIEEDENKAQRSISTGLTKREYACIELGIPETGDSELDQLIVKAERKKVAGLAMQGLLASNAPFSETAKECAKAAMAYADELLKQLSDGK